jgi:hypothetical protein
MARTAADKILLEAGVMTASKTAGIKETFQCAKQGKRRRSRSQKEGDGVRRLE